MLNALFSTYFGIDPADTQAVAARVQELLPYSELMWAYHHSRQANFQGPEMDEIADTMGRKLFPLI